MTIYRYTLYGKKKHTCPSCGKKTFNRTLDTLTGDFLPDQYGKCERIHSCGYELNPYKDGYTKGQSSSFLPSQPVKREPSYVPESVIKSYGQGNDYFYAFLTNRYGEKASQSLQNYRVGTSNHYGYERGTIFWQVDKDGNIRAGKVMVYDPKTGKRIKNRQNWVHKLHPNLKKTEFNLSQCLFGTHLLALPENQAKTVCIVESEKTAIIASIHFPEYLWLATGSLHNLKAESLQPLAKRKVILVPDTSLPNRQGQTAFDLWNEKAHHIRLTAKIDLSVSDILERIANDTERALGYDLADYLLHRPEKIAGIPFIKDVDTRYLSDRPELFEQVNKAGCKVGIPARTGAGKTAFAVEYGKRYINQNDNATAIIAVPTRAIAQQIAEKYNLPIFLGKAGINNEDIMITLFGNRICVTTYQYCARLLPYLKERNANVLTIIDEAHQLATKDFDKPGRDAVNNLAEFSSKVLYLSGTFTPRFKELFQCTILAVETPVRTKFDVKYAITQGRIERETLTVANCLTNIKENLISLVYYNSIKSLARIESALMDSGLSQDQILTITSETESDAYNKLITTEQIPEGVKVVLTTAKLCEGVNILNDNVHLIFVENQTENFQPESMVQIASRFRSVDLLPLTILGRHRDKDKPISDGELAEYEKRLTARWLQDLTRLTQYNTDKEQGLATSFERSVMNRYQFTESGIEIRKSALAGEIKEKHHSTLTVEMGLAYLDKQFNCIANMDTMRKELSKEERQRIAKGLRSNSSKDAAILEAIAFVANSLTDPIEREYIFTYAVNLEFSLLNRINDIYSSFDRMRYYILKNDAGYLAFVQAHSQALALASVKIRVEDFLTYLHYTDEAGASKLVKTVTDATQRSDLKDELSFAYHLTYQPQSPNGLRQVGRDVIREYIQEAEKFVGTEVEQNELIRHLLNKFNQETGAIQSERKLLRLLKCAFETKTQRRRKAKNQRVEYFTLKRRKTLDMILSTYNVSAEAFVSILNNNSSARVVGHLCGTVDASKELKPPIRDVIVARSENKERKPEVDLLL